MYENIVPSEVLSALNHTTCCKQFVNYLQTMFQRPHTCLTGAFISMGSIRATLALIHCMNQHSLILCNQLWSTYEKRFICSTWNTSLNRNSLSLVSNLLIFFNTYMYQNDHNQDNFHRKYIRLRSFRQNFYLWDLTNSWVGPESPAYIQNARQTKH